MERNTDPTGPNENVKPNIKPLGWKEIEKRYVGRKFRRRLGGKQETIWVIDCMLGGGVVIKRHGDYAGRTMPQRDWLEWVADAKEITK